MAQDLMSQFFMSLNLPLQDKINELTRLIDQSGPNKDLQALFPQLISNIFSTSFNNAWGLRSLTCDGNKYEFEALLNFFEPQGPIFRLCYKLLSDPQLKYSLPLSSLPLDLQISLERGRYSQFYADMLTMDSQSLNVVALALNPFDYYIFNFALYLVNNTVNKNLWENWNSVYFALACDYLMHFLPSDPNVPVLPHIPNYTGKVPMAAPLQPKNRPLYSPSLLLMPDLSGISNQHTSQTQTRNEIWRSETVLQVFIDIWMCVDQLNTRNMEVYQRNCPIICSSPERVRIVRVLVKHLHSYSAKHLADPASRSSALRKYARQIMCTRGYHYVKHLVMTWPLDASFRLVMELWLSLIQPWRYTDNTITNDRFPASNNNQEEGNANVLDASFTQFIAENFPSYTCIFQLVLPRFMRLDLTAYKNAVMLFRLGKVFSQQHLVPILWYLEQAIMDNISGFQHSPDTSLNNSTIEHSYTYNGVTLHKWVAVAKQALSELNLSSNYEYDPVWSESKKQFALEFLRKIISSRVQGEKILEELKKKLNKQHLGFWASVKDWFMMGNYEEDMQLFEEAKKVPNYLNASIQYFSDIYGLNEYIMPNSETIVEDSLEHSSFANSTNFPYSVTNKLRSKSTTIHYMGDPDLMPISSYESTILVRMLYQIATRINEMYQDEFEQLWNSNSFFGYVAREILQKPCTIHNYVKDSTNHQHIVSQNLPARISLRRFGSHAFIVYISIGYVILRLFSYSGLTYTFFIFLIWLLFIISKASLRMLRILPAIN
ncbi:unnamed protein product [Diatraea saccharalis]|uniref:Sphingomyelin phosphodiesterase 4 n=1 Tax=Diatraea saccharalis TaxID=40085 RepID=A0A9N9QUU2_9NEOP|nr:unnamed protein product [Diatraea saccharalis]